MHFCTAQLHNWTCGGVRAITISGLPSRAHLLPTWEWKRINIARHDVRLAIPWEETISAQFAHSMPQRQL